MCKMKKQGPPLKTIKNFKRRQQSIQQPRALLSAGPLGDCRAHMPGRVALRGTIAVPSHRAVMNIQVGLTGSKHSVLAVISIAIIPIIRQSKLSQNQFSSP